jgi:hypothetical protein
LRAETYLRPLRLKGCILGWLLCTCQASKGHLRLYPAGSLRTADHTTLRKTKLDAPAAFVAPFSSARGPGVVCISADGTLTVRLLLTNRCHAHALAGTNCCPFREPAMVIHAWRERSA